MNIATQLDYVMRSIWDADGDDRNPKTIIALASYVKTHSRRNHENVWEVIDILFGQNIRMISMRPVGENGSEGPTANGFDALFDVQFDDDSQILIITQNGIGNALEFIS